MKIDGIIFDMDGVLVDVSQSYRRAIMLTSGKNPKYVDKIKLLAGFNNDWDATYALIYGINKRLKPTARRFKKYTEVKDRFQLIYLGKNFDGLILNEKRLINFSTLSALAKIYKLGIATSRPRQEALFALKNLGLIKFFDERFIVAQEDAKREKPAPDPLLEAKNRLGVKQPIYVGDSVNDVIAAKKAKMPCVYIGDQKLGNFNIKNINLLEDAIYSVRCGVLR